VNVPAGAYTVTELNPYTVVSGGWADSPEGTYTYWVNATDSAGNYDNKSVTYTVDNTAPIITITGIADGAYYNVNVTPIITITDTYLNTTAITLNGNPFVSGTTITDEGCYTLYVCADDKAGNKASETISFAIDKTSPIITISGVVDGIYYNTDVAPMIDVSDANPNITSITLNGNSFINGTTISTENTYTLVVQAIDKAGNTASKSISFIIDKTLPEIMVTGIADNTYYNISVTPIIDVTDPNLNITNTTLNGVPFTSGTTATEEGDYVLFVQATDKANNTATKTVSFTIDKTKPVITITGVSDGVYYNVSVTPVITVSDIYLNTSTVTLNDATFVSGTVVNAEGGYYLDVTATDLAGNSETKKIVFTIDKTKPIINITGVTNGSYYNTDVIPIIDVFDANINITSITLNGNPFTSGNTISTENEYILVAQATDKAGNNATKTITFTIDKTPPTISNLVPVAGTKTTDDTIVISGKAEPDAVVKINGIGVSVSFDGSFSKGITLAKGENIITITVTDIAGNTKTETVTITYQPKKQEKGFIPGFEVFILLVALGGCAILLKHRKKFQFP